MLKPIAEDLWVVDHELKLGVVQFGTRTSVVRLPEGGLWLHAPGSIDETTRKQIDALGPVRFLVAPNKLHHLAFAEVAELYPDAERWLAPGLAEKRPKLPEGKTLEPGGGLPFGDSLVAQFIEGWTYANETVFLHRPSRSLLITDIVFNFAKRSGFEGIMLRLFDAYDRFGPSRLARTTMRDKAAIRRSLAPVLEWDFDRVIPTHGDILERDGRECLREAFAGF